MADLGQASRYATPIHQTGLSNATPGPSHTGMHLLLIDGNSLGYTSHHVGDPRYSGDRQVQAIYNFLRSLHYKLTEDPRLFPIVVWDGRSEFRYALHPEYKSSRNKTEAQRAARKVYTAQVPSLQKLLKHLGVLQIRAPFAEADDLGYQISRLFRGSLHHIELYTGDTDWLQLVAENVTFRTVRRSGERVTLETFSEKTGYASPIQFIEGKALKGDDSDDIEGVPGVGDVTAASILTQYGTMADFYLRASADPSILTRKVLKQIANPINQRLWERNITLMDLSRAPRVTYRDLQIAPGSLNGAAVARWCNDLDFRYYVRNPDVLSYPFEQVPDHKQKVLELLKTL